MGIPLWKFNQIISICYRFTYMFSVFFCTWDFFMGKSLERLQNAISLRLISFFWVLHSIAFFSVFTFFFCINTNIFHWNYVPRVLSIFYNSVTAIRGQSSWILIFWPQLPSDLSKQLPKNLGISSCTRKYQVEVNLGVSFHFRVSNLKNVIFETWFFPTSI